MNENTTLNIKGDLVVKNYDKSLFQEDGIIIWVEGKVIHEFKMDEKCKGYGKFSRQSCIDQKTFMPIQKIVTFCHQGN